MNTLIFMADEMASTMAWLGILRELVERGTPVWVVSDVDAPEYIIGFGAGALSLREFAPEILDAPNLRWMTVQKHNGSSFLQALSTAPPGIAVMWNLPLFEWATRESVYSRNEDDRSWQLCLHRVKDAEAPVVVPRRIAGRDWLRRVNETEEYYLKSTNWSFVECGHFFSHGNKKLMRLLLPTQLDVAVSLARKGGLPYEAGWVCAGKDAVMSIRLPSYCPDSKSHGTASRRTSTILEMRLAHVELKKALGRKRILWALVLLAAWLAGAYLMA